MSAALPMGKRCIDCESFERCRWLFNCEPKNTACDWDPSRFRLAVLPAGVAAEPKGDE